MDCIEYRLNDIAYNFMKSSGLDENNFFTVVFGNVAVIGDKNGDLVKIEYMKKKGRKFSFGGAIERASEETVKYLLKTGALYINETGIHANEPGIYPKKKEIPTQTANQSGDK